MRKNWAGTKGTWAQMSSVQIILSLIYNEIYVVVVYKSFPGTYF